MPFTIDEESLLIKGRQGESASLKFDLNQDISDYTVHFYITTNAAKPTIILEKTYANPTEQVITITLTAEDTEKLSSQARTYNTFFWWLKITKGTEFSKILIPQDMKEPPAIHIYPGVGGN